MMNSSVPLYQCWPKKVSFFVGAHLTSSSSASLFPFTWTLAGFINTGFMSVCILQACWPVSWSKTFQFAVGRA